MKRIVRKTVWIVAPALIGGIGGCGGSAGGDGFGSVRALSRDRLGHDLRWERDGADAQAIADAVRGLLARPLSASSAVQIALLDNRDLQATFEEVGIAQADLVQAGLLRNPVLDVSVRFPDRPPGHTYLDFSAAENLLDVFLIPARQKLAEAQLAEAQAHVADCALDLSARTAAAFYACQAAQQITAIRQTECDAADAAMQTADRLRQAGNVPELIFLQQRLRADQAKLDWADAQSAQADARAQLDALMGIAGTGMAWTIAEPMADPPGNVGDEPAWPAQELQRLALHQRLDLLAARRAVVVEARKYGFTADSRLFDETDQFAVGPEAERETDGQWRIGPTLSVPIPLFDQGQGRLEKSAALFRQSRQHYAALAIAACAEVRIAANHLQHAQSASALYRNEILPTQQRLLDQTLRQYNGMYASVFALLDAKRDQLEAQERSVKQAQAYWTARAELERAVGGRITLPASRPTTRPATQPAPQPPARPTATIDGERP